MTDTQEALEAIEVEITHAENEIGMIEGLVQPDPNPRALFALDQATKYLTAARRELSVAKGYIE